MRLLFPLLAFFISFPSYSQDPLYCVEEHEAWNQFPEINNVLLDFVRTPHYLYFEGQSIEELQEIKNCLDYLKCGKSAESIVDDQKNYRIHIWDNLSRKELNQLSNSCPIRNLQQRLVVRKKDQTGKVIPLKVDATARLQQESYKKAANPAIFTHISPKEASLVMEKISVLLKAEKTKEVTDIILKTWGIDLHGYSLEYTKKAGSFATADHKNRKVSYTKDWLGNPCDFVRMIRHEAEHVAQFKMMKSCSGNHNFADHKMRERAAHLNDALFIKTVCPHIPDKVSIIRNFCVKRFKENYFVTVPSK